MTSIKMAVWAFATAFMLCASAASFPPTPEGVTVVNSNKFPGVSISYKETKICETTNGVRSYSGYVHLPPSSKEHRFYDSHMYFWFFEARKESQAAPLSIWLQGGPGVPSSTAAVGKNGPCIVLSDSKSSKLNPWSWNEKVNMLYIDQPVQVGYSYDSLTNGTLDEVDSPFDYMPADLTDGVPETNATFLTGTFASKNMFTAPNTTIAAAPVMWHFMQAWIQEFPEFRPATDSVSFWGESYAGHYIPEYADYFARQNDRIAKSNVTGSAVQIHIDTAGLVNACIDIDTQMEYYPEFAFNNTYGIQAINESYYKSAIEAVATCRNLSAICNQLADESDPQGLGNQADVNQACLGVYQYCFHAIHDGYTSKRNLFDITAHFLPETFPLKWAAGYLNDADTQQALGVPLNFTGNSVPVSTGFFLTGDFVRGHNLANLGSLLRKGVKVALVYGDRDYQCNWLGGEAISLAIDHGDSYGFRQAGYAHIETNSSYVGGLVRQVGNLSFSRVFQAGHEVPYYQPETAYQIFNRVMFNADIATGTTPSTGYSSTGLTSAFTTSVLPPEEPPAACYIWDVMETCTPEQEKILRNGSAILENFILIGHVAGDGTKVLYR